MKKVLWWLLALAVAVCSFGSANAKHRHVTIHKVPPHASTQPAQVPLVLIPPLAVFYDLQRRTDCAGDTAGLGGPGFTSPASGNVLTPAIYRSQCAPQPRSYRP